MPQVMIMGVRRLDYKRKADGSQVLGYSLHYGEQEEGTFGYVARNCFLNDEKMASMLKQVGSDPQKLVNAPAYIEYNAAGRVLNIALKS